MCKGERVVKSVAKNRECREGGIAWVKVDVRVGID